ncbi:MAG: hypothetical protein ABSA84_00550 [Gammaproteobacteria bacterium]
MKFNLRALLSLDFVEVNKAQTSPIQYDNLYLVCHDNKPKDDIKAGHTLPRLGVVDISSGIYDPILLPDTDPLMKSKDLESVTWLHGNEYLACESSGKCFHVRLIHRANGYATETLRTLQLPVPKDRFFNIESVGIKRTKGDVLNNVICYDHRGGINPGEEPWSRCAPFDIETGEIGSFKETSPSDPFAIANKLNRAISDRTIGEKTGQSYFVATIDTEGSEGIPATQDNAYSFIYTVDQCIKYVDGDKIEALYVTPDEQQAIITTDNDRPNSEKICLFSLRNPNAEPICHHTIPYGIGGIAPIKKLLIPKS